MKLKRVALIAAALILAVAALAPAQSGRLRLSTTTSTDNSGLLGFIIPPFEKKTGLKVDVIAVGTGKAIALGEAGDVDVVLVHARSSEDKFVASGFGINRRDVMHNDFIILGPAADPAGVKGLKDAAEALRRIAAKQASFVSRGDESGTHVKEKELWAKVGIKPEGRWYKEAGQGMGEVITMSDNMGGYTLADRGTWLSMKSKARLQILVEGDPLLFNPYGVIAVNPAKHPHVNYDGAMAFIAWLTSREGQQMIASFKIDGDVLFFPDAVP